MSSQNNNILEGFKMTEIGLLPHEWETTKLGDLFEIKQGKALSPEHRRGISPRPFLRTANVFWGYLDLTTVDSMDFTDAEVSQLKLMPNDLLVCEGGDIGRTAIWWDESKVCCYQNHLHRLRTNRPDVYPLFYMYWMLAAYQLLGLYGGTGNKTTIPNLSQSRLKSLVLPLPPLPEQKAIALVLSTIQKAIETQDKIIAAARELKKSLMRHLFTYGPVPVGEAEKVPLKETEIGPVPEHWEVVRLSEITVKTRQVDPRSEPGRSFKYVDVSGISRERLKIVDSALYTGENAPLRARKLVQSGDVIFATVRPYLRRVAVVPNELDGNVVSTAFCVVRSNGELAHFKYIFYVVTKDDFVNRVSQHQRGSNYPAVTDKDVLSELIPLPPFTEQNEIASILAEIDKKIETEENRKAVLQALFKTMLQWLMTGRLRVNKPGLLEEN